MYAATEVHLGMNAYETVSFHSRDAMLLTFLQSQPTPTSAITLSLVAASTNVRSSIRHLSNRWPIHTGHALPQIVDVPLAQGKEVRSPETGCCYEIRVDHARKNAIVLDNERQNYRCRN
jgi:hypothetical protein